MTTALTVSLVFLWAVVAFQTVVLLGLTRALSNRETGASLAPDEPSPELPGIVGEQLPDFEEVALTGETIDKRHIAGKLSALLFVSPDCTSCSVTLDELEALSMKTDGSIIVFCRSNEERCRELATTYQLSQPTIVDEDFQLSRRFRVSGTPTAVLVGPDGRVNGYGQPMSADELEAALEDVVINEVHTRPPGAARS